MLKNTFILHNVGLAPTLTPDRWNAQFVPLVITAHRIPQHRQRERGHLHCAQRVLGRLQGQTRAMSVLLAISATTMQGSTTATL